MGYPSDRRFALSFFLPLLAWAIPGAALAQEIPLEHCDTLPLIEVKVAEHPRWFLVDTAATAMLNLQSFAEGSSRDIRVTSWSGTLSTNAKEVSIEGLEIGRTKVAKLALPAIDLSAIGKLRFVHFVGGGDMQDLALQIHGGANLLEKIGAQDAIDFASAGLPNGGKDDRGQSKFCNFGAPDFKALDADFLSVG